MLAVALSKKSLLKNKSSGTTTYLTEWFSEPEAQFSGAHRTIRVLARCFGSYPQSFFGHGRLVRF